MTAAAVGSAIATTAIDLHQVPEPPDAPQFDFAPFYLVRLRKTPCVQTLSLV